MATQRVMVYFAAQDEWGNKPLGPKAEGEVLWQQGLLAVKVPGLEAVQHMSWHSRLVASWEVLEEKP